MRRAVLIPMLLAFTGPALAASKSKKPPPKPAVVARPQAPSTPTPSAGEVACPLDGLPEAKLKWDEPGFLWLMESGDVLYYTTLGGPLPRLGTTLRCGGHTLHAETIQGGANLSMMNFDIDFSSVILVEAPRRTPEAKAFFAAKRALEAGDVTTARMLLRPLDRTDEGVAAQWVRVARLELAAGHATAAHDALRGLPLEVYGVVAGHVAASRMSLTDARRLDAAGQTGEAALALAPAEAALSLTIESQVWPEAERLDIQELSGELHEKQGDADGAVQRLEAVLARDPERPGAWLALANARWDLKDKKGAREAYAEASQRMAPESRPELLAERCPKCG